MTQPVRRNHDLPFLPAFYLGILAMGAGVHANPAMLGTMLGWAHSLTIALVR